jgi:hypothetical protein
MDWSVLKVQGVKYKFLRKELVYSSWVPVSTCLKHTFL